MVTIGVVLVDDHPLIRDGLRSSLEHPGALEVVGEAENGQDALDLLARLDGGVDIVLMDTKMPVMGGLDAAILIRERFPRVRIIMLSAIGDPHIVATAMRAGVHGYLLKYQPGSGLADAVHTVFRGGIVIDPRLISLVADAAGSPSLTDEERDLLALVARGLTNAEIARQQYVSLETVKTHLELVFAKLGAADRTNAVAEALRRGLID
jgi:DNA-binding NarL/FixJ family response regulator